MAPSCRPARALLLLLQLAPAPPHVGGARVEIRSPTESGAGRLNRDHRGQARAAQTQEAEVSGIRVQHMDVDGLPQADVGGSITVDTANHAEERARGHIHHQSATHGRGPAGSLAQSGESSNSKTACPCDPSMFIGARCHQACHQMQLLQNMVAYPGQVMMPMPPPPLPPAVEERHVKVHLDLDLTVRLPRLDGGAPRPDGGGPATAPGGCVAPWESCAPRCLGILQQECETTFACMDRDGDGQLASYELEDGFSGWSLPQFHLPSVWAADLDHSGYISQPEFTTYVEKVVHAEQQTTMVVAPTDHVAEAQAPTAGRCVIPWEQCQSNCLMWLHQSSTQVFACLDRDDDGLLLPEDIDNNFGGSSWTEQYPRMPAAAMADADRDGQLSREEFMAFLHEVDIAAIPVTVDKGGPATADVPSGGVFPPHGRPLWSSVVGTPAAKDFLQDFPQRMDPVEMGRDSDGFQPLPEPATPQAKYASTDPSGDLQRLLESLGLQQAKNGMKDPMSKQDPTAIERDSDNFQHVLETAMQQANTAMKAKPVDDVRMKTMDEDSVTPESQFPDVVAKKIKEGDSVTGQNQVDVNDAIIDNLERGHFYNSSEEQRPVTDNDAVLPTLHQRVHKRGDLPDSGEVATDAGMHSAFDGGCVPHMSACASQPRGCGGWLAQNEAAVFRCFDPDGHGKVPLQTVIAPFASWASPPGVDRATLARAGDADGDGQLDLKEFSTFVSIWIKITEYGLLQLRR